jgi:hypothetical protein
MFKKLNNLIKKIYLFINFKFNVYQEKIKLNKINRMFNRKQVRKKQKIKRNLFNKNKKKKKKKNQ